MQHSTAPMSLATGAARTWEDASSPAAARVVRRFEVDWRAAGPRRPDPAAYLPDDPEARPGAWLALLQAEMGLRWEAGETVLVEQFLARYPDLDEQTLVALLYEEFILREELGGDPDPAEYLRRFPHLASSLNRVLEIHKLVGNPCSETLGARTASFTRTGRDPTLEADAPGPVAFPEAGQTIGGFRLVEELGRGSFARVYLARERLLADRPVALKVAAAGSREPETLAILQHTHIVPVHSYRTDPATGLHLLCMPYFGRTTLAALLDEPGAAAARTGAELLAVLDRIEPPEGDRPRAPTAARRALADRSITGAIAWWGARLAEALQHAHDRGVLHRDVKPTNILVTADGLPMLLDFNLAQGPIVDADDDAPAKLGGTVAYMAPEHLDALADGLDAGVDARADLFALGVVLWEALAGERPFAIVRKARSIPEALLRTAELRRAAPPRLRRNRRPVSPALEAVLRRCLAPDPARRHATAAELAADLQAVADDAALRHAREPLPSRSLRWIRRNRLRFAVATPVLLTGLVIAGSLYDRQQQREENRNEAHRLYDLAMEAESKEDLELAIDRYAAVMQRLGREAAGSDLATKAHVRHTLAEQKKARRDEADRFFRDAELLRYRLLGFVALDRPIGRDLADLLQPFYVLDRPDWADREELDLLKPADQRRLLDAVPQLLYLRALQLWVTGGDASWLAPAIAGLRDHAYHALAADDPRRLPWRALAEALGLDEPEAPIALARDDAPAVDPSTAAAEADFLLGAFRAARYQWTGDSRDAADAVAALEAACRARSDHYWARFYLATFVLEAGRPDEALRHADTAVALRPDSAWALFNRSTASLALGDLDAAMADLRAAARLVRTGDRTGLGERIALNRGYVLLAMGDREAARRAFEAVAGPSPPGAAVGRLGATLVVNGGLGPASLAARLATIEANARAGGSRLSRAARLDRTRLDDEEGRDLDALLGYTDLLVDAPGDLDARLGRTLLLLAIGALDDAAAESDALVAATRDALAAGRRSIGGADPADRLADALALRGRIRLARSESAAAIVDAETALRYGDDPDRRRLELRALLASGRFERVRLTDPADLDLLPAAGPSLAADLRAAADALAEPPDDPDPSPIARRLTRAVLLSAIGDREAAEHEATGAVLDAPDAALPRLVRARLRERSGAIVAALDDLDAALGHRPDDVDALNLRAWLLVRSGRPDLALGDLARSAALGSDDVLLHRTRAAALSALGRPIEALVDATAARDRDPEDPRLLLARARLLGRLDRLDEARADLALAASWCGERPELLLAVALGYLGQPGGGAAAARFLLGAARGLFDQCASSGPDPLSTRIGQSSRPSAPSRQRTTGVGSPPFQGSAGQTALIRQ